jgi:hypothetical protein
VSERKQANMSLPRRSQTALSTTPNIHGQQQRRLVTQPAYRRIQTARQFPPLSLPYRPTSSSPLSFQNKRSSYLHTIQMSTSFNSTKTTPHCICTCTSSTLEMVPCTVDVTLLLVRTSSVQPIEDAWFSAMHVPHMQAERFR